MANTKSAKKALRVSSRRRSFNIIIIHDFKEARKAVKDLSGNGNAPELAKPLSTAFAKINFSVKKGVIHKNTGSRYKSRIAMMVNKAETVKK